MRPLVAAAMLLCLAACAGRELGKPVTVARAGYMYVQVGADYEVLVSGQEALRRAISEICGTDVCTVEAVGELYRVRVEAK